MRVRINRPKLIPDWMASALESRGITPHPMWLYIDIKGADDCWPWIGASNSDGYGRAFHEDKRVLAHRLSYCLANSMSLEQLNLTGLLVRHECDQPPCCNPAHLVLGTHAENANDKVVRGRMNMPKGSKVHTAILTEEDIPIIRRRLTQGDLRREIADAYGVSLSAIDQIKAGRNWSHVT